MKNLTALIADIAFLVNLGDISVSENLTTGALVIETLSSNSTLVNIIINNLSDGNVKSIAEIPMNEPITFKFSDDLTVVLTRKN